jgi:hypothetical protein
VPLRYRNRYCVPVAYGGANALRTVWPIIGIKLALCGRYLRAEITGWSIKPVRIATKLGIFAIRRTTRLCGGAVANVERVVLERGEQGERTDGAKQYRIRGGVTAETPEEELYLLMDHRALVAGDVEFFSLAPFDRSSFRGRC